MTRRTIEWVGDDPLRDCGVAAVISNNSDLKLPIEIAQSELGIV